ncbi:MAG: gamma carbonic anhydrase family protein [Xanthomonadales bacterium]|nr:gamma carbonic anhydrase family protein [Xanthomonadales bacterium]
MIYQLDQHRPEIDASAWVADDAVIIGRVQLREEASVWFGSVLRGDMEPIVIGPRSNIQDGSVMHTDDGFPLTVGEGVTVGHRAVLHGCTLQDNCLVGINAVVLNGAVVGRDSLIGANALVREGQQIPPRSLVVGSPCRVVRELTGLEIEGLRESARHYAANARRYREGLSSV